MEEICLGIMLDDQECRMSWYNPETQSIQVLSEDPNGSTGIPCVLGLDTRMMKWYTGEDAKELEGRGGCVVLNQLVTLFHRGYSLQAGKERYSSDELLQEYLKGILTKALKYARRGVSLSETEESLFRTIKSLVLCIEDMDIAEADRIRRIGSQLGLAVESVHLYNRQECFMYYLMSQKHEIWSNVSYLFDYRSSGLFCYELSVIKGLHPLTAQATRTKIEEAPPLEMIREGGQESEDADRWLAGMAGKKMTGKIVSSVILTGEGFSKLEWARQFIRQIYSQKSRKVYQVENIYEMGAAFAAYHMANGQKQFPYLCICEGRISTTVSLMTGEERKETLVLVQSGMNGYEARASLVLNIIEQKNLDLYVRNTGATESYRLPLNLAEFMEDGRERTRIRLSLVFPKEDTMLVRVEDLGFGEFYPSTGKIITQRYTV